MNEPYILTKKEEEQLFSFLYSILPTLNKKTMEKHIGEVWKLKEKLRERFKRRSEKEKGEQTHERIQL